MGMKIYNTETGHFWNTQKEYDAEIEALKVEKEKQAELGKQKEGRKSEIISLLKEKMEIEKKISTLANRFYKDYADDYFISSTDWIGATCDFDRLSRIANSMFNHL